MVPKPHHHQHCEYGISFTFYTGIRRYAIIEREREANVVERQRCKYTNIFTEKDSPSRPTTLAGPATHPSGYISTYSYSGYTIMFDRAGIACPSLTTSTKTTGKTSSTSAKSCAVLMACVINGKLVEPLESSISQRPSWTTIRNLNNPKDRKRWTLFDRENYKGETFKRPKITNKVDCLMSSLSKCDMI